MTDPHSSNSFDSYKTKITEPSDVGDGREFGDDGSEPDRQRTERLDLRKLHVNDAADLERMLNDRLIYAHTDGFPFPLEQGVCRAWIESLDRSFLDGSAIVFGIERRAEGRREVSQNPIPAVNELGATDSPPLIGVVGLEISTEHQRGELGFWLGADFRGQGYASEAATELVRYGFEQLGLKKISASHVTGNEASSRILTKLGMRVEGVFRQHIRKSGAFHDLICYGRVREACRASTGR